MMAWWLLKDGLGQVRQTPFLSFYSELSTRIGIGPSGPSRPWGSNYVISAYQNVEYTTSEASSISRLSGDPFGGPLFRLKAMRGHYSTAQGYNGNFGDGETYIGGMGPFSSAGVNYPPIVDPNTGILVPPAYPINIMLGITSNTTSTAYFNQGGRLPGIYKSLSGTDEFMNRYYVPGQNFIVDSENYYPYVTGTDALYRDMFLIRRY